VGVDWAHKLYDRIVMMGQSTNRSLKILMGFLVVFMCAPFADAKPWRILAKKDGVTIWTREVPGSDIDAVKGETIIDAPIEKLVWVVTTCYRRTDWVKYLSKCDIIEMNKSNRFVAYQAFDMPWPVSDRDFILKGRVYSDNKGAVRIDVASGEDKRVPKTVGVRASVHYGTYAIFPLGPNRCRVIVEAHTEPNGIFPDWLTNHLQRDWPLKTLAGLKKQVKRSFVKKAELPANIEKVHSN
jgi:hypothetical protein